MDGNIRFEKSIKLSKPSIVGYMSTDILREYRHDLSQLKYLTSIPQGELQFDLNHNINKAVKRTTDDNDEKITLMLKFILDQKNRLQCITEEDLVFVTYRRTLINVMCNKSNRTPLRVIASLYNNCIYLCSLESPQELLRQKASKEQHKFCAWGYKYEQYMLSDSPNCPPCIEKPVIENEEFSMYYCSQLGRHKLFYGAQIDGMMATQGPFPIPNSDNVDDNLAFLVKNCYVELKTNREIYHRSQEHNFKKHKLLKCWCQCYLADLRGLLVGYRNDDGIIQRVEWFDTPDLVKYCKDLVCNILQRHKQAFLTLTAGAEYYTKECIPGSLKGKWDPQVTINYLNSFLSYVKNSFKAMKETCGENSTKPLTLKFDIDDQNKFTVTKTDDEKHTILPNWYVDGIQGKG